MKKLTQDERLEYWKYLCATLSFDFAGEVAKYLISNPDHPLLYQLITSLYVLYGRPFKQQKKIRITEEIVPEEYFNEHNLLVSLRDKTFAHTDIDGLPEQEIKQLSKILMKVRNGTARYEMASFLPHGSNFERIEDLCKILHGICFEKSKEILILAINGDKLPDLTYEIDISEGEKYLIKLVEYSNVSI